MDHPAIIAKLGGASALARSLGIRNTSTVAWWARGGRCIPAEWWDAIAALPEAAAAGVDVAELAAGHPRRRSVAAAVADGRAA